MKTIIALFALFAVAAAVGHGLIGGDASVTYSVDNQRALGWGGLGYGGYGLGWGGYGGYGAGYGAGYGLGGYGLGYGRLGGYGGYGGYGYGGWH